MGVAHCPRSNGYLGCGVAPVRELRDAGVPISIATDSPASTPSLDMFDEIRAAIVGARAREGRPDALTAADALELATLGGARVLGMEDRIGSLVAGKQADLAVISLVNSPFDPVEDPVTAAVLGGIGSVGGAAAGGLIIGVLSSTAPFLLLDGFNVPSAFQLKDVITFLILVLVLIFRPTGLFGGKDREKV